MSITAIRKVYSRKLKSALKRFTSRDVVNFLNELLFEDEAAMEAAIRSEKNQAAKGG